MSNLNRTLRNFWPVQEVKKAGCYFYNISIEDYISTTKVKVKGKGIMDMFGGYSYLSLHKHPRIENAVSLALEKYGTGGHGVRLLAGTTKIHKELEGQIANFKESEQAITFSSGYITNISVIPALVNKSDTIISDSLNHRSIIDGCFLSKAQLRTYEHNDMVDLEAKLKSVTHGNILVIADAVFSMDGDIANLPKISWLCKKYGAILMLDESHSLGVIGKNGKGIEEHYGMRSDTVDIKMGTFSKTIPSQGGYIAGKKELIEFLRHTARGFLYSGANSPCNDAASLEALRIIEDEPERIEKLHVKTEYARQKLNKNGISIKQSSTAIIPVQCGSDWNSWKMAKLCQDKGIYIQAIPFPVVPKGEARLRLAINSDHSMEQINKMIDVISSASKLMKNMKKETPSYNQVSRP